MATKHGHCPSPGKRSPTLTSWNEMWRRTTDAKRVQYNRYGGRGIKVCKRWKSFLLFVKDMGERPSLNHSLERKDNNKNYSPSNCVWATKKEQARNRATSRMIVFNEKKKSLAQWCEDLNINYAATSARINRLGWSADRAFTTPFRNLPERTNEL